MIHSSYYKPRAIPYKGDLDWNEIDRLQDMSATITLNRTKIEEIGRSGIVDWKSSLPSVTVSQTQLEYGSIEYWNLLANQATSNTDLELSEFTTSQVDIVGYKTDDDGDFLGSVWYPKMKLTGFGVNIGSPEGFIERTFNFIGDNEIILLNNNKYLIYLKDDTCTGADHTITIGSSPYASYPDPVEDPDNSGQYILRVTRIRSGNVKDLTYVSSSPSTDQYTYDDSTKTITFGSDSASGDIYKIYYSASSYISGSSVFSENDSDLAGISADSCSIYLGSSNYLYRLQSVGIEVAFDRRDIKEIGNDEIVATGVRDTTVRVTLGRILESHTIEQVLRGQGTSYGKIDMNKLSDDLTLIVKVYEDADKSTFKIGYKFKTLSPVGLDAGVPLNDYINRGATLEGEEGLICSDETTFDAWS